MRYKKIYRCLAYSLGLILYLGVGQLLATISTPNICFVAINCTSDKTIEIRGDCLQRESPCSTFKILLSLMGFDAGILKNATEPIFQYRTEFNAPCLVWQQAQIPQSWITNSCIWYSQQLTTMLGIDRFRQYVQATSYGNNDISGDLGQNNGLTKSWLCSSLTISAIEQTVLVKKLLDQQLPFSVYAHEQTKKLLFVTNLTNGWQLFGKTGAGITQNLILSWFVGWATNIQTNQTIVFACLIKTEDVTAYINAKQEVLHRLENMLKKVSGTIKKD